jgi:hypothetical protein
MLLALPWETRAELRAVKEIMIEEEDEQPAAKPPASRPAATAEGPVFEMKDGTRIVGTFTVDALKVETAYGLLTIPVAEIAMIRIGTRSDPELGPRISALVKQLGDADFNVREKATAELARMGQVARRDLEGVQASADAEVRERAAGILAQLEDDEEEPQPEDDEVVTTRFTVRGTLQCPRFQVATKYGPLTIEKRHLLRLMLRTMGQSVSVKVPGNRISSREFVDTRVPLKRGALLSIRARGTVMLTNWSQQCGPEGNPNCGQCLPGIPIGALMARIGANGTPFKVGESYQAPIDRDGTLFLAVGCNNNGQQNTGEYRVEIVVKESP